MYHLSLSRSLFAYENCPSKLKYLCVGQGWGIKELQFDILNCIEVGSKYFSLVMRTVSEPPFKGLNLTS